MDLGILANNGSINRKQWSPDRDASGDKESIDDKMNESNEASLLTSALTFLGD